MFGVEYSVKRSTERIFVVHSGVVKQGDRRLRAVADSAAERVSKCAGTPAPRVLMRHGAKAEHARTAQHSRDTTAAHSTREDLACRGA